MPLFSLYIVWSQLCKSQYWVNDLFPSQTLNWDTKVTPCGHAHALSLLAISNQWWVNGGKSIVTISKATIFFTYINLNPTTDNAFMNYFHCLWVCTKNPVMCPIWLWTKWSTSLKPLQFFYRRAGCFRGCSSGIVYLLALELSATGNDRI